jgi:hypothetical protein
VKISTKGINDDEIERHVAELLHQTLVVQGSANLDEDWRPKYNYNDPEMNDIWHYYNSLNDIQKQIVKKIVRRTSANSIRQVLDIIAGRYDIKLPISVMLNSVGDLARLSDEDLKNEIGLGIASDFCEIEEKYLENIRNSVQS